MSHCVSPFAGRRQDWNDPETQVKEAAMKSANATCKASRGRILVVEDNDDSREILAKLLRMSGYEVSSAPDGESAYAAAISERPDLIITDINMPGMDGIDLLKKVRLQSLLDGTAILVVTAFGGEAAREAMEAGADAAAAKPFDFEAFIETVQDLIYSRAQTVNG